VADTGDVGSGEAPCTSQRLTFGADLQVVDP